LRHTIKLFLFLFISLGSIAQVTIDLPVNKSVFQRNTLNKASIYIAGSYSNSIITSVQARLVTPTPGTSTPINGFNWTIIDKGPTKGKYFGSLVEVPAGWYTLEVRIVKNGTTLSSTSLSRVGIGDVYLAFGQSNAQGLSGSGGTTPGSTSGKVVTHNFLAICNDIIPPFPSMQDITSSSTLGQTGESSWIYGRLGDNLVADQSVPVAIFNAASLGASVDNFVTSSNGAPAYHFLTGNQFCQGFNGGNGLGSPYAVFKKNIRYYNSLFGIRAILWHQGETDTYQSTSQIDYTNRLNSLIAKTRTDFGQTMPWLVSRASYINTGTSANVINGQNAVISSGTQVFNGPSTDDILAGPDRSDQVHFSDAGIVEVADKWSNIMTTDIYNDSTQSFFDISTPIPAKSVPNVLVSINGSNVTLTAPGTYSSYKWVNGNDFQSTQVGTGISYTASSGTYRCYMLDANENVSVSQAFNIANILSQQNNTFSYADSVYLSDQIPYSITNGLGPISLNQSVGLSGDGDGSAILMKTVSFTKGIGVHSGSEVVYKMPSRLHKYFKATIGVNDNVTANSSVVYKVYGESTLLYTSPTITNVTANTNIQVDIAGYSTLKLVVENSGGILDSNQVNWANARIIFDKPAGLNATNLLAKCFNINWLSHNDQKGIASYQIFKNGVLEGTAPSGTLTYQLTGLNQNTMYTIGVKSIDNLGNITSLVTSQITTAIGDINYPQSNVLCVGIATLPLLSSPNNGTFSITYGGDKGIINPVTGAVTFSAEGLLQVNYQWGNGDCSGQVFIYLNGVNKVAPPSITSSINLANTTDSVTFTSTACTSPAALKWSNNMTVNPIKITLSDTTVFYALCDNSNCLSDTSNKVTVKVIPNCKSIFNLTSVSSDLDYGAKSFKFNASQKIIASNKIINPTGAIFKAAQNIELKPGFEVRPGSVFSATIGGCP
jgi:hypothetical protein